MTALALIAALLAGAGSGEGYRWPLDLPRTITSSFGEYRAGRFHAAIDLRTGGIGIPVYAADDGYVARVRCSPWGYGKAVYLKLNDGTTAVYAHLDDYYDELRAYVRRVHHSKKDYEVELYPEAGQFPVRRGQLIAKSGQTGIGAPHLHFELRDEAERPVNPRLRGLTWPDETRPILRQVLVAPQGPGSTVNGDLLPALLAVNNPSTGVWTTAPVRASGRIGLALNLVDKAGGASYQLGVWRMRVTAGGAEVFTVQQDRISYDDIKDGAVAFHPYFLEEGRFQVLWRWPGNQTEFYAQSKGDGWCTVPAGPVDLLVEITDFLGNTATLTVPVRPDEGEPAAPPGPGAGQGTVAYEVAGTYLALTARFSAPEPDTPELLAEGGDTIEPVPFRRVDAKTFRAAFLPARTGRYVLRATHPRLAAFEKEFACFVQGQAGAVAMGGGVIEAGADTAYGVLFARIEPAGPQGLNPFAGDTGAETWPAPAVGRYFRVWPPEAPMKSGVTIALPLDGKGTMDRVSAYRMRGPGWTTVDEVSLTAQRLRFATRSFGTFAVLRDVDPPSFSGISVAEGARLEGRRPKLTASLRDGGSGLASYSVSCGGQWLLFGYDPEHDRAFWERDADLPSGTQTLVFEARDNAGNVARVSRTVVVP